MHRSHTLCLCRLLLFGLLLGLSACSTPPVDRIDLMPAPDVYGDGRFNPLPDTHPYSTLPYDGILFATDRAPATPEDGPAYYLNDRGYLLRVGLAEITFGKPDFSWETAREISLLKSRGRDFPVTIRKVHEWGILEKATPFWIDLELADPGDRPEPATEKFTTAINEQLARSRKKDVYIYVHGYKVPYENPVLVSAELWHFLGYNGAFIAYAWPSTPSTYAYIRDSDTSAGFARNLRILLEEIAENTDVETIHIVGYSNGSRLVVRALEQLALIHRDGTKEEILGETRIGNVILVGSDLDRYVFGAYVAEGVLNVARHISVYVSKNDKALGFSNFLTRRARLGEMWGEKGGEMHALARPALRGLRDDISFINVTPAEGANAGNGHGYFRKSPWVSSDVLMSLYYSLEPEERGLVMQEDLPVYTFPPDYISRLWKAIGEKDPERMENLRALQSGTGD